MSQKCKFVLLFCLVQQIIAFRVPQVDFELENDGFRISIPDQPGIKYVGYQVNKNRPFTSYSEGEFSAVVRNKDDNRWTYKFNHVLKATDVIYVWTSVQHELVMYRLFANPISVINFDTKKVNIPIAQQTTAKPPIRTTPSTTIITPTTTERGCDPSITEVADRKVCRGDLIFEDTFDTFNPDNWQHEVRFPLDTGDSEFVLYDTQAMVENGILNIKAIDAIQYNPQANSKRFKIELGSRCTPLQNSEKECNINSRWRGVHWKQEMPPIVVPRINTKKSLNFKYGTIEIRAKMPKGDWLVPLILLEPSLNLYGHDPYASGQLRVAFSRGNERLSFNSKAIDGRVLFGGAVLSNNAEERHKFMVDTLHSEHLGNSFHTYKMVWGKEKISYYLDNVHYGDVSGPFLNTSVPIKHINTRKIAPFDEKFFITLGLSVGGFGDFPEENNGKLWENTDISALRTFKGNYSVWKPTWLSPELKVDYLRIYAI